MTPLKGKSLGKPGSMSCGLGLQPSSKVVEGTTTVVGQVRFQSHGLASGDSLVVAIASTMEAMLADQEVLGMAVAVELSMSKWPSIWEAPENL